MADPGAGNFRFNAGTPAAASALAVSALTRDAGSPDLSDFVATWDDSTNPTGRGLLSLRKLGAPATFAVFVVQSVVDNGAWLQIAVTHLSSAGSWSAADTGVFAFARSGDKGLDGAGTVVGVSAGNASIAIGGTAANPTIAVAANGVSTARLAREGSAGQVLTSNGAAADPSYQPLPAGVPAGIVVPFAGSVEPAGWLFAAGQAVGRATYAALFAALGTAYGAGDGSTTFNLPDLRGRAAAGRDNMNGTAANRLTSGGAGIAGTTLGAAGGSETHVLTAAQMPAHTHSYVAGGGGMTVAASFGGNDTTAGTPGGGSTSGSAGSGAAHPNAQPTLVLNYIVKT
ncbi:MAG: tail fiber protein [Proteobacteria bacterium]|nr:tail fiber protein [Pseudomonadota bacterium]